VKKIKIFLFTCRIATLSNAACVGDDLTKCVNIDSFATVRRVEREDVARCGLVDYTEPPVIWERLLL
jgi:hypothetical protein